jgi:hypothetical protein
MPKLKHWGTIWVEPLVLAHVVMVAVGIRKAKALCYHICAEPLALLRGVRESRRDGIYCNNGLKPIGRNKRVMLTRANPLGMGHIAPMDFSPDLSTISPQRQENNYPEIASCLAMTVVIGYSNPQPFPKESLLNGNVVTDNYFAEN